MCSAYPGLYLCNNVSIAAYSDCMFNPTSSSCMNYQYPTALATSDVISLCTAMPYMSGCTIFRNCNSSGFSAIDSSTDLNACNPFDIMTTICTLDTGMRMMGGCRRAYNTMCAAGTMIKECSNYTGMAVLPTTTQANSLSKSICTEMTMDGCSYCDSDWAANKTFCSYNDLVVLYSYLCYSMPDMTQCPTWKAMCAADPTLFLCTFSSNSSYTAGPAMMMYFNTQTPFYLLWKTWTPKTPGKLCGAFFAMFFLTLFYEFCQLVKANLEAYEKRILASIRRQKDPNSVSNPKGVVVAEVGGCESRASNGNTESVNTQTFGLHPTLFTIMLDIARMIMAFITSGIGYLLMLGVMCFNVTIFFSVITGFGIGAVLFGRLKMRIGSDACSLSEAMCH
nr:CTr-type copper ion transporter (CTR1) [Polytomella parva]|eukprot:CAMPEP_0175040164 /NCGR_PEP_ID=MMETSP0052_2-20121109/1085_1 /TAXON_ID=51329 ORGANISM="Polytomella parva, Strain SAG 63-3" /NCGR_SAMPLE_ID=MMETSP0052_2 /ASSEMBLY_ACC=CAM_ASM_000194 /LENGTH=392 /DNA_ID=CAMNT_0016302293 /DNA_START=651 /DNA_END=1829 /DNA_ORIENTATION=-